MGYWVPDSLEDALEILSKTEAKVIAGGTDYFPALGDQAAPEDVLDVSRLSELRSITREDAGWRIGASVRWTEIARANLPDCFDGLKRAALEVGSWQIQNAGTIAGNICNASPAADGVPPLMTLGARVEIRSTDGVRVVSLEDFIIGVRQIDLGATEIVSAILIPDLPRNANSHFLKLGSRKYLVISIAMVAAVVWTDSKQRILTARIAVGSCSAVATRLAGLETALKGMTFQDLSGSPRIWKEHLGVLSPISDVRSSGEFRLEAAEELCKRTVLASLKSEELSNG